MGLSSLERGLGVVFGNSYEYVLVCIAYHIYIGGKVAFIGLALRRMGIA